MFFEPLVPEADENGEVAHYEFDNEIMGGRVPREYIPSVDAGVRDAMLTGVLAGYPIIDVKE